ncbi:MAG TPA: putative selenate ABC transporter substrate-binding protein [Polyangia bacterium]|jgi:phosphonate transport system substrate-binding protein|nr:putative selenate ABC transporter substrate-binding protein [Polyangia bacterium]
MLRCRPWRFTFALSLLLALSACRRQSATPPRPLVISAIPDQDPARLQRLYGGIAAYLSSELGVPVVYKPVTDYTASVTAFKVGDLDLVWYGGLTGVQARLQVPGAHAIVQRDIDDQFHSVFIAHQGSGIHDLAGLKGRTFTFGSESSTSGRLMPQYFLQQQGLKLSDFKGEVGFSGSHDKTINLVTAGTYDAGALNEQVWKLRLAKGTVDLTQLTVVWTSPPFHDYHWVVHPSVAGRYGDGFIARLTAALTRLDPSRPKDKEILELFGAQRFVPTEDGNYAQIEAIGRQLGLIVSPSR